MFDRHGEVFSAVDGEEGIYYRGVRHVSRFELTFGLVRPLLLSSTITHENQLLCVELTNPDFECGGGRVLPRGSIHVRKTVFLHHGACHARLQLRNFMREEVTLPLSLHVGADFRDIFEIRGHKRARRGELRPPSPAACGLDFSYLGLDGVERSTRVAIETAGDCVTAEAESPLDLSLRLGEGAAELHLCFELLTGEAPAALPEGGPKARYEAAWAALRTEREEGTAADARVTSSCEPFNAWVQRSRADLHLMLTNTPYGPYPYAGVPWFSAPFGRDGIITALQTLWVNPQIARGVLRFLARTQATEQCAARDAEPGKILHESRHGEMANLGEIPFARYYGSVDSTPLFVTLAGEYLRATGDAAFVRSIWENILAAMAWIETSGDADGDGFLEFARRSANGLAVQGWKDSHDSVFHADGSDAHAPVALCEVQGYAYQAFRAAARIAASVGRAELAGPWREKAEKLKAAFNERFWCEELGTFALALDGAKRPCRVRTSNPGHCLFSGIVDEAKAPLVAAALLHERTFCGWGLRTVAEGEARYNPMSYHNGSVWPHDTALAAAGLARYGQRGACLHLLSGMLELSRHMDLNRLPELLCGFERRPGQGPTLYPLSCAPQAWAAGAVFQLLQASLGLRLDAGAGQVVFDEPELPAELGSLRIEGLRLGALGSADLELVRHGKNVGLHVLRCDAGLKIICQR